MMGPWIVVRNSELRFLGTFEHACRAEMNRRGYQMMESVIGRATILLDNEPLRIEKVAVTVLGCCTVCGPFSLDLM